jgi:alcohol dehydrogenase class IV
LSAPREHRVSFRGSISYGGLPSSTLRTLVVDDTRFLDDDLLAAVGAEQVVHIDERPNAAVVDHLATKAREVDAERVLAVGSGALIDAVKLAWRERERDVGRELDAVFVPCGPEPYRAVARFAVVDDACGERPTVVDDRFARALVCVAPTLLDRLPDFVVAVHALDSAVHAIESLLSTFTTPISRALAIAALRTIAGEPSPDRARLVTSSFLAVEAFASTRLGIAHAIASPLAATLGVTHDTINGVLGEAVVEFWGAGADGFADVADACGAELTAADVTAVLARLRADAGVPDSLQELGIPWPSVERILPRAAQSSGIAVLPSPVSRGELEAFARRAWKGRIDEEVADARPA